MCFEGDAIGGFTIQADGQLLLFMAKGAIKIWDNGNLTSLKDFLPKEQKSRFNDVLADPEGRVFCGTMPSPDHLGRLYRLDTDGTITEVLDEIKCSNGMGFTLDVKSMYYTDSGAKKIYLFDYDQPTGELSNQRVFADSSDEAGVPDGMTVDAHGYVWSAGWDRSCLTRIAPDGSEERRVEFPAKKVSCVTFGGEDYTDMYVTTAGGHQKVTDGAGAGALYRVNLGIRGIEEHYSRIDI